MTLSFLADEHVKRVYVFELRANGYDVAWIDGDYEPGTPDRDHLETSRVEDRVIISNDADFARLSNDNDHGGIILYDDQGLSVSEWIRGIKRIERFVPATELRESLVWLDAWTD